MALREEARGKESQTRYKQLMRDFFKKQVLARTYEIFGVNQLEKMEDDQITFLLDALENVSQLYDYIPQVEQKKIINKRLLTDRDFRNINARLIAGWFEMDGKIFFTQKHHKENEADPNYKPLEGEERDNAIQTYLDALAKVQLNFTVGEEKKGNGARMREQLDAVAPKPIEEKSALDEYCETGKNEPLGG